MRKKTLALAIAATSAALALGSLGLTGTAKADPGSPQTYTGVGSNTTQDVMAALAGQTVNGTSYTALLTNVGSYEATPTGTNITPKCGVTFPRPNGSTQGVQALSASLNPNPGTHQFMGKTITGCVQFARSSSGPSASGTDLTYVPFARDAVGYIYTGSPSVLGSLTKQNLTDIYNGLQPISGVTIKPYIPQSGSGSRAFWLKTLGVTTLGSDVQDLGTEENNASVIHGQTNAIYPFSISSFVAQWNGVVADTGVKLSDINLGSPNSVKPTSPNGPGKIQASSTFYQTVFGRDVYNVFQTSEVTASSLDGLASQFITSTSNPNPVICGTNAGTRIKSFGFLLVPSYCGAVGVSTAPTGPYTE